MTLATCRVIRAGEALDAAYDGRQAVRITAGISRESAGAQSLSLHRILIPAGRRGDPHVHRDHESAVHVIDGAHEVWFGTGLHERIWLEPGDFLYIPANVPHLPVNRGPTDALVVVARTDASEQESVQLTPWPEELAHLLQTIPPIQPA